MPSLPGLRHHHPTPAVAATATTLPRRPTVDTVAVTAVTAVAAEDMETAEAAMAAAVGVMEAVAVEADTVICSASPSVTPAAMVTATEGTSPCPGGSGIHPALDTTRDSDSVSMAVDLAVDTVVADMEVAVTEAAVMAVAVMATVVAVTAAAVATSKGLHFRLVHHSTSTTTPPPRLLLVSGWPRSAQGNRKRMFCYLASEYCLPSFMYLRYVKM